MLKYERIIRNLTLEEKIDLLLSEDFFANSKLEDFDLPSFHICKNDRCSFINNDYPSNAALASTWNEKLIKEASKEISIFVKGDEIVGVNANFVSKYSDEYFNGKIAASVINGINEGSASTCLYDLPETFLDDQNEFRCKYLLPYELAIRNSKPTIVSCNSVDNTNILNDEWKYQGFTIVKVVDEERIIEALIKKNTIIYTELDAKTIILDAVNSYIKAKADCVHEVISKAEFDELELGYKILNPEILDEIIDRYLDGLASIDSIQYRQIAKEVSDENSVFKKVADEGIVLLKNNGILPLDFTKKVAIVGQYAKDVIVNEKFNNKFDDVISSIDSVDFEVIGFAYGYLNDDDSEILKNDALKLCDGADCAIVYLGLEYGDESETLPKNQLDFIDLLYSKGVKIIAVVTSNKPINMDFEDKCEAIIYSKLLSSQGVTSTIEIIGGKIIPSGKTIEYFPINSDIEIDINDPRTYKYPFGYGLTYSVMEYKNFSIDKNGVELTIYNAGAYDAFEVVQLYVEYQEEEKRERKLRGFKKIFVKSGESIPIQFEFDDITFRSFFEDDDSFGIRGGKYNVLIGSSVDSIEHSAVVALEETKGLSKDHNDLILQTDDYDTLKKFINESDISKYPMEDRGLSFGQKLILSIVLSVYANIMLILLLIGAILNNSGRSIIIMVLLLTVFDIGFIIYLCVICIKKRQKTKINVHDEMTKYVEKMDSFNSIARRIYPVPVRQDEIVEPNEDFIEDEIEEIIEETVEEQKPIYHTSNNINEYDTHEFNDYINFEDFIKNFIDFALKNGLIIEPKSARMLFSAFASSQLVFVRSESEELLPKLLELLSRYLGSMHYDFSLENIDTIENLIWVQGEDESFSHGKFVEMLRYAKKLSNHIVLASFSNFNVEGILDVLGNFAKYLINPNDDYLLDIGTKDLSEQFIIPRNIKAIAIFSDYNDLEKIPSDLAIATLSVEVNLGVNTIIEYEEKEYSYISYTKLIQIIHEAKEKFYLPEEMWKKLDDFEEGFNNFEEFRYENKAILIYEKYCALLMETGVETDEVIDYIFSSGIIPSIKSTKTYKNSKGDETIFSIIDRIFGADSMPMTETTIKKPN